MKKGIHPDYHKDAKIICACGQVFEVGSTSKETKVELCSACHPFYTGKQKFVDTQGRVDRFKKIAEKTGEAKKVKASQKTKEEKKALKTAKKTSVVEETTVVSKKVRLNIKKNKPTKKRVVKEGKAEGGKKKKGKK